MAFPAGLDVGRATDVGRVREANEDSLLVVSAGEHVPGRLLAAVADGMGGHRAGEVASAIAIDVLGQAVTRLEPEGAPDAWLSHTVEMANGAIWDAAAADAEKDGMGTTLVCAVLDESGSLSIANVGDSRAYACVDGRVAQVSIDHTWVNQQVLSGQMTEREASQSPYRNLLTRSLGSAPRVQVDLFSDVRLASGDALVLVSDGVSGYLDEADLAAVLRAAASAQEAADRLVQLAVQRGGADNATAVVVRRR